MEGQEPDEKLHGCKRRARPGWGGRSSSCSLFPLERRPDWKDVGQLRISTTGELVILSPHLEAAYQRQLDRINARKRTWSGPCLGSFHVSRFCRKQSPDYKESAYERKVRLRKARVYGKGRGSAAFANADGDVECGPEEGRE